LEHFAQFYLLIIQYSVPIINNPPNALFTFNCQNLTCNFDGSKSSDSDGIISDYSWSFGESGVFAIYSFPSAGTYSVMLDVTDDFGATDSVTSLVTVKNPSPVLIPTLSTFGNLLLILIMIIMGLSKFYIAHRLS